MTVPMSQILLAMLLSTICLLVGRVRLALFVAYCFVLYWGKPWQLHPFTETTPVTINGPEFLLIAFCFITVFLAMLALAFHRD